jgi:mono/diheme cytochrome c family protein
VVARQVAASSGELPAARREAALADVVASHGDDPIVADLAVSALPGRHVAFLERVLAPRAPNAPNTPNASDRAATVRALAAAVFRSRDAAGAERVVALAGEASRPRWQRLALLEGASMRAGGRGEPPAEGGLVTPEAAGPRRMPTGPALSLPHRPAALLATAESKDTALSARARRVAESLAWPGKSAPATPAARPLTAAERARYAAGQQQYLATCAGCHQPNGMGLPGVAKPLAGSAWAQSVPARVIRIVLHGKEGQMLMPPIGASLSDEQIANILTYVRRSWGNSADPIDPTQVREIRGATAGRTKPWTEAELSRINR